jgi:hypothetical protein
MVLLAQDSDEYNFLNTMLHKDTKSTLNVFGQILDWGGNGDFSFVGEADDADFKDVYFSIIKKSVAQLKDDRFACFVVGDVRDKKGFYYNFISDTIQAFKDSGMELYNEIILVNTVGSLAIRVKRQFNGGRKVGKMHQNVLVFYKGDPMKIKENFPELNLGEELEAID